MCLVAVAWRAHARYPLIVAGNRDEFHERPAAAAAWWDDASQVFGGRDLAAGGSWLAVDRRGRFAVVTNHPGRPPGEGTRPSRGRLVADFVTTEKPSGRYLDAVQVAEDRYAGFCLLVGTRVQVRGLVSPQGAHAARWTLKPGITVVTNSPLETPWPKAGYLESSLRSILDAAEVDREAVFGALGRREPVGGDGLGDSAIPFTPFVVGERYGTRATTVILMDADGSCEFEERRYGPGGVPAGTSTERFPIAG